MSTATVAVITVLSGLALLAAVTLFPSLRQRLRRVDDESPL
jgi:hypothetical protein